MARPNRRTRARLAAARRQAREDAHRAAGSRPRRALELTLPVPPGMTPDELRAALALFADELRADGMELGDVHVCTSPNCVHEP